MYQECSHISFFGSVLFQFFGLQLYAGLYGKKSGGVGCRDGDPTSPIGKILGPLPSRRALGDSIHREIHEIIIFV